MELSERKLRILQAIVDDFISSAEPMGSRTLSKRLDMDLSPATIRNEMSDLEEMGYLTHPHTSAGRVPSDKAYRLYVDKLMERSDLSEEEKSIISDQLSLDVSEFDRTVEHAASLLSEMTNLMSFAITPSRQTDKINYVTVLPVDERTVVLMIVTEEGKINNTAVKLDHPYTEENLTLMSKVMTHNFKGKTVNDVLTMDIARTLNEDLGALSKFSDDIAPSFIRTLEKMLNVDLYMDGYTNIFNLPEYNDIDKAKGFFEKVNQKDKLAEYISNRDGGLVITIGEENDDELKDYSLITADYKVNGKLVGKLGVIGPKRMKYDEISSIIKYMTDNLSRTFALEGEVRDDGE